MDLLEHGEVHPSEGRILICFDRGWFQMNSGEVPWPACREAGACHVAGRGSPVDAVDVVDAVDLETLMPEALPPRRLALTP